MINNKYNLLGKEELEWVCEFCGKKEISLCYTVQDMDTGEIKRFGSVCIKKALGITSKELRDEEKANVAAIKSAYYIAARPMEDAAQIIMDKYRKEHNLITGFLPRTETEYWEIEDKLSDMRQKMYAEIRKY